MNTEDLIDLVYENPGAWVTVKPTKGDVDEHDFKASKEGGRIIFHRMRHTGAKNIEGLTYDMMIRNWKGRNWDLVRIDGPR